MLDREAVVQYLWSYIVFDIVSFTQVNIKPVLLSMQRMEIWEYTTCNVADLRLLLFYSTICYCQRPLVGHIWWFAVGMLNMIHMNTSDACTKMCHNAVCLAVCFLWRMNQSEYISKISLFREKNKHHKRKDEKQQQLHSLGLDHLITREMMLKLLNTEGLYKIETA